MRGIITAYLIGITCAFSGNAQVIAYEIDPTFNSELLLNKGNVSDILHTETNQFLVMGSFNSWDSPVSSSALINNNGALFHAANFAGAKVENYKGDYLQYGSDLNRFSVPGGGLYDLFKFEFKKQAFTGPLSNVALDAMVMPDDNILVAGRFFTDSTLMGTDQSHLGLRQLCMIDSTGAPVADFPMLRCAWPTNSQIHTIHKLSTGQYIIAGRFEEVEGHLTNCIARLNADFTVDTEFVSPLLNSATSIVRYIDSQDRIWIFFEYGILNNNPNNAILHARLLADGSVDQSFNIPVLENRIGNTVYNTSFPGVYEDSDGTFILSGDFTHYNDTMCNRLVKIYDNGHLVHGAFELMGADEAVWGTWMANFGPNIAVIRPLPDGKLLLGGRFSSFGGEPYSCLVRLQPNGFVGINETYSNRITMKVWPNPAHQVIQYSVGSSAVKATIYDLTGRVISGENVTGTNGTVDVNLLPDGLYTLSIRTENGMAVQKFVKQNR